jgi:hypothetical protein
MMFYSTRRNILFSFLCCIITIFLIGLIYGFSIANQIFLDNQKPVEIIHDWKVSLDQITLLKAKQYDPVIKDSPSISDLYIAMVTGGNFFTSRALPSYKNWMQQFSAQNNFIITSNDELNYELPRANIVRILNPNGSQNSYWHAQYRFVESMYLLYAIAHNRNDTRVKWFMLTDDDTFIVPYNLMTLIQDLNIKGYDNNISIIGNALPNRIFSGGGVLFSRNALQLIIDHYSNCPEGRNSKEYYDVALSICVRKILDSMGNPQPAFIPRHEMRALAIDVNSKFSSTDATFHYITDEKSIRLVKSKFPNWYFILPKNSSVKILNSSVIK